MGHYRGHCGVIRRHTPDRHGFESLWERGGEEKQGDRTNTDGRKKGITLREISKFNTQFECVVFLDT
jgi:hypothetical protein